MKEVQLEPNSKIAYIDADTILYRAAMQAQENRYRLVNDHSKNFKGKRDAYAWAAENGIAKADLELEEYVHEVKPIAGALKVVRDDIETIAHLPWVKDFRVCIGGGGNFRDELGTIQPYKGHRGDKPVHLPEVKNYVIQKFKERVIQAFDEEADDVLGIKGWEWYHFAKKQGSADASEVVLCYIDKDLDMIPGYRYNYLKKDGVFWQDNIGGWACLCKQVLMGDKTDNIPGLPRFSPETAEKFGVRKPRAGHTIGEKTAYDLLESCRTVKQLTERVIDVYKTEYGSEPFEMPLVNGTKEVDYKYLLDENAILLWMRSHVGEMFSFVKAAEEMGVEV